MAQTSQSPEPPYIRTPGGAAILLVSALLLMLVGGFLTLVQSELMARPEPKDFAIFQTWLGTTLFQIGLAFLVAGLVIVGVRAMLQQQTEAMLARRRE
ncbi:MAG: hypothetical protein BGN97_16685 [Microbacterium sp. 69-10]|uniref:hypothetical protein n=1 Tax=Microbacterium sp. 69-10 TaxID=1895783 RepID=UPI0009691B91|nr:hypothetical protein [Microbacterium sp. 69-10]OJU40821.1 MAG: hypothetical protein BGN97_16685 [Microbacterium sp. 69-10]